MTVDEVLADPAAACELPDDAVPIHVLVIVEYAEPGSDDEPGVARLTITADDTLTVWGALGMLRPGCCGCSTMPPPVQRTWSR